MQNTDNQEFMDAIQTALVNGLQGLIQKILKQGFIVVLLVALYSWQEWKNGKKEVLMVAKIDLLETRGEQRDADLRACHESNIDLRGKVAVLEAQVSALIGIEQRKRR